MIKKWLFFSKKDGDELQEKINQILENQKKMLIQFNKLELEVLEQLEAQKNIDMKYSLLVENQKMDNDKIFGIVHQLLLKDLLEEHRESILKILEKYK
ncbi:hypothetical protein [Fusobacterium necrophorum]|uniref:hypothetical protein n=1 Tax=Fusobacterium necrophorum TaxID=859 RepID=UPI003FA1563E